MKEQEDKDKSIIEQAKEERQKLEAANEERKKLIEQEKELHAKNILSGDSLANQRPPEKSETDKKKESAIKMFEGTEAGEALKQYG